MSYFGFSILRTSIIFSSLEILLPELKRNSQIHNTKFSENWPLNFDMRM